MSSIDSTRTGWDGILDKDEAILWQGRPKTGIIWADLLAFETFFGLVFAGFSVFWITAAFFMTSAIPAASAGGIDSVFAFFPLFGLPFLLVGLYMVIGRVVWDAYRRRGTWYTLTDRAAYIAREIFGRRSLKRYALGEMMSPDLHDGSPGSVFFAQEISRYHSHARHGRRRTRTHHRPVGFRHIEEARQVYRLIVDHRDALES